VVEPQQKMTEKTFRPDASDDATAGQQFDGAASTTITVTATVTMDQMEAIALQHLWNARRMAALCRKAENDAITAGNHNIDHEVRGLAMLAYASAAAFVESLINEIFSFPADSDHVVGISPDAMKTMKVIWNDVASFERSGVLDKYQTALAIVGKPEAMPTKGETRKRVGTVLELRNSLLHYKPKWQSGTVQYMTNTLGEVPRSRQVPGAGFPSLILNADSAEWACDACAAFVDEWSGHMGLTNPPDTRFQKGDWPTP
jgi:hypothetical protein